MERIGTPCLGWESICALWRNVEADLFKNEALNGIMKKGGECFDMFHVEGDKAILDNIVDYLNNRRADSGAGIS